MSLPAGGGRLAFWRAPGRVLSELRGFLEEESFLEVTSGVWEKGSWQPSRRLGVRRPSALRTETREGLRGGDPASPPWDLGPASGGGGAPRSAGG